LGLFLAAGFAPQAQAAGRKTASVKTVGKAKAGKAGRKRAKGGRFQGRVVAEHELRARPLPHPSGNVHVFAINSHEELKVNIYNPDGSYNEDSLQRLAHILRCKRTGQERPMEPRLMALLSHVYDHFGGRRLEVVSGFRFQRRTTSHHFSGTATDIRVEGIDAKKVRDFVYQLDEGGMGVGYYPKTHFVHIDVRPLPSFRWTDYSRSDPDARDKQPPRGWKKKRVRQS